MEFNDWLTQFTCLRAENPKITPDPLRFYGQLRLDLLDRIHKMRQERPDYNAAVECVAYNQASVEGQWYRCRNPYFKVFPTMVRMLANTDINVPARFVHAPLRTILYRLPEGHDVAELKDDSGKELRCILVDELNPGESGDRVSEVLGENTELVQQRRFIFWFDWGEGDKTHMGRRLPIVAFQVIALDDEDASFEDALKVWLGKERFDWDKGCHISEEALLASIRLTVGICLLATNANRLIEHDVLNKHVGRYRRTSDSLEREGLFERAKKRGKHGWLVGRELALPALAAHRAGEPHEPRGELTRSHVRRGHFHTVRYGVGHSLERVDWFPPTLVRADLLGSDSTRGYRTRE